MSLTAGISTTVDTADLDALIVRIATIPLIIEKYTDLIYTAARRFVRVKTGALRASIRKQLEAWAGEVIAGEGLDYAAAQEYGTATQPGTAFIRPAAEQYREAFQAEIAALFA
jgi:HK97 gp10 family phage protein